MTVRRLILSTHTINQTVSCDTHLDLDGILKSLSLLLLPGIGLGTHDTTAPVPPLLLVLIGVALLDR